MVKEKIIGGKIFFECDECRFLYKEKSWAEKCQAWCKERKSCNLEIIKHGIPPK